jgi:hypothetical protein
MQDRLLHFLALFPAGDDGFAVLREAALVDLPELETSEELLECIRSNATQPAVPEEAEYVRHRSAVGELKVEAHLEFVEALCSCWSRQYSAPVSLRHTGRAPLSDYLPFPQSDQTDADPYPTTPAVPGNPTRPICAFMK